MLNNKYYTFDFLITKQSSVNKDTNESGNNELNTKTADNFLSTPTTYWGFATKYTPMNLFQITHADEFSLHLTLMGEKFHSSWLSTYGHLGYYWGTFIYPDGSTNTYDFVRIPTYTIFLPVILLFNYGLKIKPILEPFGAFPLMDGFTFHIRNNSSRTWLSIYFGTIFGLLGYDKIGQNAYKGKVIAGLELGTRLYFTKSLFVFIGLFYQHVSEDIITSFPRVSTGFTTGLYFAF